MALAGAGAALAATVSPQDLASLTNSDRVSNGQGVLGPAADLASLAQRRAEEMAAAGRLSHTQDLGGQVANWRKLGENVGRGRSLAEIERSYMASAPHRENILAPDFTEMGVGVAVSGDQIYTAVIFRLPAEQARVTPSPTVPRPVPVVRAAAPPKPKPAPVPPPTTTAVTSAPPPPAPVEAVPAPAEITTSSTTPAPPATMPAWLSAPIDPPERVAFGAVATIPQADPGIPASAAVSGVATLVGVWILFGSVVKSRRGALIPGTRSWGRPG